MGKHESKFNKQLLGEKSSPQTSSKQMAWCTKRMTQEYALRRLRVAGWQTWLLTLFICMPFLAFAQQVQKAQTIPEVRKAIPVPKGEGEPQRGERVLAPSSGSASGSQEEKPTSRQNLERKTSGSKQGDTAGNDQAPNTMAGLNDKRPLGIGDKISLSIAEDEKAPMSLSVTDSGEIEVPYIGRVSVGGKTCKQLASHVKRLLEKEYYYEATVLISLDSAGSRSVSRGRFYLSGQVLRPGPYELPADEALTVGKAIIRAGGFSQYANKKKVKLMRSGASKEKLETTLLDMVAILEKGEAGKDVVIQPDDTIIVDEKFFNFN